jgi:hypothetical protein
MTVKATITAEDLTLATPVYHLGEACIDLDHVDAEDHDSSCRGLPVTLADLIVSTLLDRAMPAIEAELSARASQITEEEIRHHVRDKIAALGCHPAGLATGKELTLAELIDQEITRQLHHTTGIAMTRGAPSSVVAAVIATAVTQQFRDLAAETVAQVIAGVREDIAQAPVPVIPRG